MILHEKQGTQGANTLPTMGFDEFGDQQWQEAQAVLMVQKRQQAASTTCLNGIVRRTRRRRRIENGMRHSDVVFTRILSPFPRMIHMNST